MAREFHRSASSVSARWVPASPRCSPATACRSSPSRSTRRRSARGRGHLEQLHRPRGRAAASSTEADQADAARTGSRFATDLDALADVDLVVEAVPEHLDLKRAIFTAARRDLQARHDPRHQHLVAVGHRDRGGHRPPGQGRRHALLQPGAGDEAGRGRPHAWSPSRTSSTTSRRSSQRLGKTDVTIGDRAGFIANALLFGYLNHAVALYESRYASREDIDAAMKLGCGLPMGPLALLDLIGLDTAYEILDTMYKQSPRPAARPAARSSSR